ncbi:MAG: PASTA domain-containing protein, partial [Actinomycetales bacterium]|nr:PASTA domain-containing protein [Actinomycetales bacterium]
VDIRTDIYAIGIVLFEMLTGKIPFTGDTAVAVAHQHIHAHPPAPSSLNPKVSMALDQVVFTALAKDKADRFQNTEEFARELRVAASSKPGGTPVPVVIPSDVDSLLGANISEPALEKTESVSQLPDDFLFLFGDDPQTAPTLIQPELYKPEPKRLVAIIAVIALIFGAIAGMGVWVATLKPVNLFPSTSISVPVLKGQSYSAAEKELKNLGLSPVKVLENSGLIAKGKVIRTEPGKAATVENGAVVQVFVSDGKAKVSIPDLSGATLADAKTAITAAGFIVGTVTETTSPNVAAGLVISTTPIMGTELFQGEKINLTVSNGKVELPDLRGKTVKDANGILATLMLPPTVQADASCAKSADPTVRSQSVAPGVIAQGTAVTISYCTG